MPKYRATLEVEQTTRTPDVKSSTPRHFTERSWDVDMEVVGDAAVVASTLRAMADRLDPPKPKLRGSET